MSKTDDEAIAKEARRLYSTMFGKLLDETDETPSKICDRLYLGSAADARNFDKLQRLNIKYILNMTGSTSNSPDYSHITLLTLDAHDLDDYDLSVHFPVTFDFIQKSLKAQDGSVLVHCAAGVSRSAAIVAAYLMINNQISAFDAVLQVHQARPCVCPNLGFLRQLLYYEKKNFVVFEGDFNKI